MLNSLFKTVAALGAGPAQTEDATWTFQPAGEVLAYTTSVQTISNP